MEDDLDDLDDLMGATPKQSKNVSNMDMEDDDDFFGGGGGFGGGGNAKADDKSKKNKVDANDPLAFLHRAQAEKQSAAEKKAMKMQQAHAKWKTMKQLTYNLNSDFMDYQDKWKMHLGTDIYKDRANLLAVDPQIR